MADRRTLLVAALVALGLLLAACGLAGPMLDSASLSHKLGEHGYVNANVTVAFNASNGTQTNTLTVTVDRPRTPP